MTLGIRQHVEALVAGESGTTYTLAAGRFHRAAEDIPLDRYPTHSAERAFDVLVVHERQQDTWNGLDGFSFERLTVTVRVAYVQTNAGGDLADALSEQSGPATADGIADRVNIDTHSIRRVLQWHENLSSNPATLTVEALPVRQTQRGPLVIAEVPFVFLCRVTQPGSYEP